MRLALHPPFYIPLDWPRRHVTGEAIVDLCLEREPLEAGLLLHLLQRCAGRAATGVPALLECYDGCFCLDSHCFSPRERSCFGRRARAQILHWTRQAARPACSRLVICKCVPNPARSCKTMPGGRGGLMDQPRAAEVGDRKACY